MKEKVVGVGLWAVVVSGGVVGVFGVYQVAQKNGGFWGKVAVLAEF